MPKIVKFHSIYYRFVLFIVFLYLFVVYQIAGREIQEFTIFNYAFSFHQTQLGYCLLLLILVGIGINFLYLQKGFILEDQLYLFLGVILVEFRMFGLTRRVILVVGLIFITINVQFFIVMITSQFVSITFLYWLYLLSNSLILRSRRISYQLVLLRGLIFY